MIIKSITMTMSKIKILTLSVIILVLINIALLMFIFSNKSKGLNNEEGPKQIIIERLEFNESQIRDYFVLVDGHKKKTKELNKKGRELHNILYQQLKENTINQTIADSVINVIAENQKAKDYLNISHFKEIKDLCDAKQKEKFNVLVDDLSQLFSPIHNPKK